MPSIWWFVGHNEAAAGSLPSLPIDVVLNAPGYSGDVPAGFPHLPVDVVPAPPRVVGAISGSLPSLPIVVVLNPPVAGQDMPGQLPTLAIDVVLNALAAKMGLPGSIPSIPIDVGFVEGSLDAEVDAAPTWPLPTNEPVYHRRDVTAASYRRVDPSTPPVYRRIDR